MPAHAAIGDSRHVLIRVAVAVALPIVFTLALLTCVAANDEGMGTLAGTVVAASGAPVVNARVTLQGADGGSPDSTTTNDRGRFFFPDLGHGYYDVRAYSNGAWSGWMHNVEVKTGKQTEVTLRVVAKKKTSG